MKKFPFIDFFISALILAIVVFIIPYFNKFGEDSSVTNVLVNKYNIQDIVDHYRINNNGMFPTVYEPKVGNPQFINFNELDSKQIHYVPENEDDMYYWVDYIGNVWSSTILPPSNFEKTPEGLIWENVIGGESYKIYEVTASPVENNNSVRFSTVGIADKYEVKPFIPDRFSPYKEYVISVIDKDGNETPPVYEGFHPHEPSQDLMIGISKPAKPFLKNRGGSGRDVLEKLTLTKDGNYIAVGSTMSDDGDIAGAKYGEHDFSIVKFQPEGEIIWAKTYGGSSIDVLKHAIEVEDGFIAVGHSDSTDFDLLSTEARGGTDIVLLKTDIDGNKEWIKRYGGSEDDEINHIIAVDDGFYAVGMSKSSDKDISQNNGGKDFLVAKFDYEGEQKWIKTYGGSGDDILNMFAVDDSGNLIAVGTSNSTNIPNLENKGETDGVVMKVSPRGDLVNIMSIGGSDIDELISVNNTVDGFIIGGHTRSLDLGENKGNFDFLFVKLNKEGEVDWERTYGGSGADRIKNVQVDKGKKIIFVGDSMSNDGDIPDNKGDQDIVIGRLEPNGDKVWIHSYGGSGTDFIKDFHITMVGDFIAVGNSYSNDGDFTESQGDYDFTFARFSRRGLID